MLRHEALCLHNRSPTLVQPPLPTMHLLRCAMTAMAITVIGLAVAHVAALPALMVVACHEDAIKP